MKRKCKGLPMFVKRTNVTYICENCQFETNIHIYTCNTKLKGNKKRRNGVEWRGLE